MGGFCARDKPTVSAGIMTVGAVADEIRAEEVEGEGGPEEPFVMSEAGVLVLMISGVSAVELHPDIEAPPCPSCGSAKLLLCLFHLIISLPRNFIDGGETRRGRGRGDGGSDLSGLMRGAFRMIFGEEEVEMKGWEIGRRCSWR